ncbi:uncharacterized protein LOC121879567 [Homarus americanus]|uniref:uncharacterized protein LOC121879567 n=1 Tax=Homarus americanus TaxID=6706 RepID=UPI001C455CE8|nr:uncharacterized protein LOC121879567 [Homarus americanus]XP_042242162.1 uncharacterized protein LOC121879567 [Homarus americanus]
MSGKLKHRNAANTAEAATVTVNEKILKECHNLYTDAENGLVAIGESLGLKLLPPRKKINVMLMGNHSAGKSSFINWYVEEHVQRTGVAIETQGFSFVTSGRKRESLTGNATLHLYPHFKALQEIDGVVDYLNTEISTSKQKKFSLVTFIDTPGLVDGDMKYPFDVNQSMLWLGDLCDLIFVFFDPIGQALCKRTLNIVEKLNETHSDRIRFYLSKADEAGHESDRQRVMMQIVQELCKRPGLNKTGFEMPTIYIPNPNKPTRCVNQVEEVCKDIEKTINQTIQNTLNQLERDCEQISHLVDEAVEADNRARSYNFRAKMKGMGLSLFGFFLPVALLLQLLVSTAPRDLLNNLVGSDMAEAISSFMSPTTAFWETIDDENQLVVLTIVLVISGVCLLVSRYINQPLPTLQRRSKKALAEKREFVNSHVKAQKQKLYSEYLQQSVSEHDL